MSNIPAKHNPHSPGSGQRVASPQRLRPDAKSRPAGTGDFKGLSVGPGSSGEAQSCVPPPAYLSKTRVTSDLDENDGMDPAKRVQDRESEVLIGLGHGKRKAEAPITPPDDPKKPKAQAPTLVSATGRPLDSAQACARAILSPAQDPSAQGDVHAALESAAHDVATRLGGMAIDAPMRERLFDALLLSCWPGEHHEMASLMRGATSACLPQGCGQPRRLEWLGHFQRALARCEALWGDEGRSGSLSHGLTPLACMAATCGLSMRGVVDCLLREYWQPSYNRPEVLLEDFAYNAQASLHASLEITPGSENEHGESEADVLTTMLDVWRSHELPWHHLTTELDAADDDVVREWAIGWIRRAPEASGRMVELLLLLEHAEGDGYTAPTCRSLLERLLAGAGTPEDGACLAAVLDAVLREVGRHPLAGTPEGREVLRAFVLAAVPFGTPVHWVSIGMHDACLRFSGEPGAIRLIDGVEGPALRWLEVGLACAFKPFGAPLMAHEELTERDKLRLARLPLTMCNFEGDQPAQLLGAAATLSLSFDARTDLMAALFQLQPGGLDASHFAVARQFVVGQLFEVADVAGEGSDGEMVARQVEVAQSLVRLHRAWREGRDLAWQASLQPPTAQWLRDKRQDLQAYQRFLEAEIRQLGKPGLPVLALQTVLDSYLRPTLAEVREWLARPRDGKADGEGDAAMAIKGLDEAS